MKIRAIKRDKYGTMRTYCLNGNQGEAISILTGHKTLTNNTIKGLRMLGAEVEVIDPYAMQENEEKGGVEL